MSVANENTAPIDSTNGRNPRAVEEVKIPVPWGHISGKWWGPIDQLPIVALHGWQDNAGTFDSLIPYLSPDVTVLCIDFPGHGFSSHYSKGQYYYVYWESLLCLRRVIQYYRWTKVKLLGHSLGGAISFLYAASYPNEVEFVISLDIVGPTIGDVIKRTPLTGSFIDKFLGYESLKAETVPTYTYEEILRIAEDGYGGDVSKEGVATLMKRGIRSSYDAQQYYFTRDPRLKIAVLGLPSLDVIYSYASQIKCAYLNIRASKGFLSDQPETYNNILEIIKPNSERFEFHEVEGTHFVHLNNPERVAPIINKFIST